MPMLTSHAMPALAYGSKRERQHCGPSTTFVKQQYDSTFGEQDIWSVVDNKGVLGLLRTIPLIKLDFLQDHSDGQQRQDEM